MSKEKPETEDQKNALTVDEVKKKHFPKKWLLDVPVKFASDVENIKVKVDQRFIELSPGELIKDARGAFITLQRVNVGGYRIEFNGKSYETNSQIEVEALQKAPNVVKLDTPLPMIEPKKETVSADNPY